MGLYCVPCQKPFLNDFALGVHKQTAHKLDTSRTDSPANTAKNHELLQSQAKARREIGLYCAECNMVFRTKHQLEIHIRTTRHQPGIPILPSELGPPAIHHDICLAEHVPDEIPDPHERSERHVNACKARDLCCNDCSGVFLTVEGLWSHDCRLPSQDPSAPGHYPCRNCPQKLPAGLPYSTTAQYAQQILHSSFQAFPVFLYGLRCRHCSGECSHPLIPRGAY